MKVNVNYPLPTVHMNGTSRDRLLEGEMKVYDAIDNLLYAIRDCEFHGRDYYPQDPANQAPSAFKRAQDERTKHTQRLIDFKQYNLEHVMHLRSS